MAINSVGREVPEEINGRKWKPYQGPFETVPDQQVKTCRRQARLIPGESKMRSDLKAAILASGLKDGMTISFHHHFREGDRIIGQVLTAIRELGIKGLKFAPSAVVNIKEPSIVNFVKDGTINRIEASGIRGQLGDAVIRGLPLAEPVILRPHGGRPRAIEAGELEIDVAFIGASASDCYGNANGTGGKNACGSLGYAKIDARSARQVVVITDTLVDFPCVPASICQDQVDHVVVVEEIGDSSKIGKGAARQTKSPRDLRIAELTAEVIAHSGFFADGFSFQTGAGAIAIACTNYIKERMKEQNIRASFVLGGVPAAVSSLLEEGLVDCIQAVQSFDAVAAMAMAHQPRMVECDNSTYSNPHNKGCFVNQVNIGVLGALEVDTDFNVNILTGSSGEMMGGLGGGPDVAAGADVSIVTLPLFRGRTPSVVDRVFTLCTPGETVAVVVTDAGIALNPKHRNYPVLKENLEKTSLKLVSIEELRDMALGITGVPKPMECTDQIVAVVEYRDGTLIDVIRQIRE
ncbi:citrate lyase subunit alpha [Cuneatibacter sp. NSJ-177]|uniref:citrate lyase subunit alpha n=1 Tax=Cuneatibacter sp. NSJ-177 TaxID=2931401 RepID=UPI001FD41C5E|nr:citrate lyase subunit alpha [Cuneatibacter sp. NSJ-177]MCJ7837537.1 citrate lyase subunit alpha [Cuneatibacter sp. NSJ-177]